MLARHENKSGVRRTLSGLWHTWRNILAIVIRKGNSTARVAGEGVADRTSAAFQAAGETISAARDPLSADMAHAARVASWTGLAAVGIGAGMRVILGALAGDLGMAVLGGVTTMVWALARLLLMRFAPHAREGERSIVATAWGIGLLPYLLAVSGDTRAIAWVVGAWLTRRTAIAAGIDARRATHYVMIAWGVQAGFYVAGWLAQSAGVVFLGSLG